MNLTATVSERERPQFDLGQMMAGHKLHIDALKGMKEMNIQGLEALERFKDLDGNFVFRFDPDTAKQYAERWKTYVQGCGENGADCPFGSFGPQSRERDLEKRIEELEAKLQALAKRLESRSNR
jgi:uncharacterized protein YceH (UPF0502 family)